jgi:TrmH family RNA methyltransferase
MKTICSVQNELIKKVATLQTTKGRLLHNQYIAEGLRTLERFAAAHKTPTELYVTENLYTDARILFKSSDPIVVPEHVMKKISPSMTPPGILGVFGLEDYSSENTSLSPDSTGLVLANITDPGNMGTLIRSAAACGYKTVIVVEGVDPFSPKVIQASAGSIAHVSLVECSWNELIKIKNRPPLCAMTIDGTKRIEELPTRHVLLVVGNEAHGLPAEWVTSCEQTVTLPMDGSTESFNAAVAGSIALFLLKNNNLK